MSTDDKKLINRIPIDTLTHTWLVKKANIEGVSIAQCAGTILNAQMTAWVPLEDDDNPSRRLFLRSVKFEKRKWLREKVYKAAAQYKEDQTEEAAEDLQAMCEDAGLDYKEVMSKTGNDPFSSIIAMSRNGTKFGECLRWLPERLMSNGGRMAVTAIQALGSQHGFTPSMLSRAKRAIDTDRDTPRIESVRSGRAWIWEITHDEPDTPEPAVQEYTNELYPDF